MKKIFCSILTAISLLAVSCEEWEPVIGHQGEPREAVEPLIYANTTIAELKSLYKGKPIHINEDKVILGQVISSDVSGNIYRSLYIQDESGAIEVKVGNSSLYNDYKVGQWVYVKCLGLVLGNYGGMLQIGMEDPTGEYESAYIDVKSLIAAHIIKGPQGTPVIPRVVTEGEVKSAIMASYRSPLLGTLVTLDGLTYGNEIFVLIYLDGNADKKASSNRLFLSDKQWGVDTWAMSAQKMKWFVISGLWDSAQIGNSGDYNYGTVGDPANRTKLLENSAAYSVSQYFKMPGGTEVQVRSSGYAKFADQAIDQAILNGAKVSMTGILTNYNGAAQFTLIDLDGVKVK